MAPSLPAGLQCVSNAAAATSLWTNHPLIAISTLSVQYGNQPPTIDRLSTTFGMGGVIALVGASGVGKSTLLGCLAGILDPSVPSVSRLDGTIDVCGRSPATIRGSDVVSWVPQSPTLLSHLSVTDNVLSPLLFSGVRRQDLVSRAEALLHGLGLGAHAGKFPRELSGGQRTRVSVARSLVTEPKFLFMDEPFSGLDLANRWIIYRMIRQLRSGADKVTIFTTHNVPEAVLLAEEIVAVRAGQQTTAHVFRGRAEIDAAGSTEDCLRAARDRAAEIEGAVFP